MYIVIFNCVLKLTFKRLIYTVMVVPYTSHATILMCLNQHKHYDLHMI